MPHVGPMNLAIRDASHIPPSPLICPEEPKWNVQASVNRPLNNCIIFFSSTIVILFSNIFQQTPLIEGLRGQHGAHLGPTGPRWAPCWPHELCSLGCDISAWNEPNTTNIYSAVWVLMTWCFSKAPVATVFGAHRWFSSCLWVKHQRLLCTVQYGWRHSESPMQHLSGHSGYG